MMRCPLDWEIYRRPSPWDGREMGDRHNGHLRIPKRQKRKTQLDAGLDVNL